MGKIDDIALYLSNCSHMRLNLRPNLSNYLISFLIRKYCDKAQERYVISSTMDNLIYKERNETYTRAVVSVLYKPSVGYVPGASPQPQRKSPHFRIYAPHLRIGRQGRELRGMCFMF